MSVDDPEVKKEVTVNVLIANDSAEMVNKLINYFSRWISLKKSVAWIIKIKEMLLQMSRKRRELSVAISEIESDQEKRKSLLEEQMRRFKGTLSNGEHTVQDLAEAERNYLFQSEASI
ncbi:UNVERIFIED_CONTAM: hypothetical protein FKN15_039243 [Acipenser sinensis]